MPRRRIQRKLDVSSRPHLKEQLDTRQRKLRKLELKAARFGYHVPAYIEMEIEDEKKAIAVLNRQIALIERNGNILFAVSGFIAEAAQYIDDIWSVLKQPFKRPRLKRLRRLRVIVFASVFSFCVITLPIVYITANNNISSTPYISPLYPVAATPAPVANSQSAPSILQLQRATIRNTGGIGVRYRSEPRVDSPSDIGPKEGETVYLIELVVNPNGERWWKTQFPDKRIGYILERYIQIE